VPLSRRAVALGKCQVAEVQRVQISPGQEARNLEQEGLARRQQDGGVTWSSMTLVYKAMVSGRLESRFWIT